MSGFPRWLSDAQGEVRLWNGGKVPAEDDGIVKSRGQKCRGLGGPSGGLSDLCLHPKMRPDSFQDNEIIVKILNHSKTHPVRQALAIAGSGVFGCHESVIKVKETRRRAGTSPQSSVSSPGTVRAELPAGRTCDSTACGGGGHVSRVDSRSGSAKGRQVGRQQGDYWLGTLSSRECSGQLRVRVPPTPVTAVGQSAPFMLHCGENPLSLSCATLAAARGGGDPQNRHTSRNGVSDERSGRR